MDLPSCSASETLQDPSFPLPPPKRRRIGSSQQPSHFLPEQSPPLPPPIPVAIVSRSRGRPRRQITPGTTSTRSPGRPRTLPSPVAEHHGPRGRPPTRPLQFFEALLLPLGFISEFHNVPEDCRVHDLGARDMKCDKCHALFWKEELMFLSNPRTQPKFFHCCKNGDIVLPAFTEPPQLLRDLYAGRHELSSEFHKNIRQYNAALAFTSIVYTPDRRLGPHAGNVAFQIHGELYHLQGPLHPRDHDQPRYAQLFLYDPQPATDSRHQQNSNLNRRLLSLLDQLLREKNRFYSVYRTAKERLDAAAKSQEDTRIILNPQLRLIMEKGADRRRENLPTGKEVALLIPEEEGKPGGRDLILAHRPAPGSTEEGASLKRIHFTHPAYMPLHYVLLFPDGDVGRHFGLRLQANANPERQRLRMSAQMYYRYRLFERPAAIDPNIIHCGGRLFQQYIVDAYSIVERERLEFLRREQPRLRCQLYDGIQDSLAHDTLDPTQIGKMTVLPSSFAGSDRAMQQLYQDAMALVRHIGKPDLFITFTANPKWNEITSALRPGQSHMDRPDVVARVFRAKLRLLIHLLKKGGVFGKCKALVYTVEYQKRTLPHAHILLCLEGRHAFTEPEQIDNVIRAELPDRALDPDGSLTEIVKKVMVHGPCGSEHPKAPCMQRKYENAPLICSKHYPRDFSDTTVVNEDGYPTYRRRRVVDGAEVTWGDRFTFTNQWVVPYNPFLTRLFEAHINVEVCTSIKAIKYIHKYIYKGPDKATLQIDENDEITRYLTCRYVGPTQAMWSLLEFPTHEEYPNIVRLALHLPNHQNIVFRTDTSVESLEERAESTRTTLMAFFDYNREHDDGRHLLYHEFPSRYVFRNGAWKPRQRCLDSAIGRIYNCTPNQGERYYLRLLLVSVPGPTSFEDLRTVNGVLYDTFQEACLARRLIENDTAWVQCFEEAVCYMSGERLRSLFIIALTHGPCQDPPTIWERFRTHFCDDLAHRLESFDALPDILAPEEDYGLYLIEEALLGMGRTLSEFRLPRPRHDWSRDRSNPLIRRELDYDRIAEYNAAKEKYGRLNEDQKRNFDILEAAIRDDPHSSLFFLQGHAGTGKTFLYETICHHFRSQGKVVLCVASSGIAAQLLPGGMTSHSRFKIPLNVNEDSVCSINKGSQLAALIERTHLIVWDEVPMQHKYCFEAVSRTLADIRGNDLPFGGIPVLLGGDFAQIPPVVPRGTRASTVAANIRQSMLWPSFRILYLERNMRVQPGPRNEAFADWIQSLSYNPDMYGRIDLPNFVMTTKSVKTLFQKVFPPSSMQQAHQDWTYFQNRVILTTLNDTVADINDRILPWMAGETRVYEGIDSVDTGEEESTIPIEFLRAQNPSSLPPAKLKLKVGTPIILLRNLFPAEGLCNGTRLVVKALRESGIEAVILGGQFHGQRRYIPRILLTHEMQEGGWTHHRRQFPVRRCFAMTINKAQGQSFDRAGVDLRLPVFMHGQLYVALSRVTDVDRLHVLLPEGDDDRVENVVYRELLLQRPAT